MLSWSVWGQCLLGGGSQDWSDQTRRLLTVNAPLFVFSKIQLSSYVSKCFSNAREKRKDRHFLEDLQALRRLLVDNLSNQITAFASVHKSATSVILV